ncbi:MAG: hypothetical protein HKO02_05500 [Hyphomonadaceae bacterium]|nr:hypothetical protein [Hyphomonadaceae bacterium]
MTRHCVVLGIMLVLSACANAGGSAPPQYRGAQQAQPMQPMQPSQYGQYQQPVFMQPEPTQRIPRDDLCRSRLYLGLIGQHEGSVVFSSLPGRTRVVKPAETEEGGDGFLQDMQPDPPFVEIREYLAGQILYAPAIRAVRLGDALGPIERDRLTVELDRNGYVAALSCR